MSNAERAIVTAVASIAARQHGVVGRKHAQSVGVTRNIVRGRLRAGEWELVGERVIRIVGSPDTFWQRVMVAVVDTADAGGVAVGSHRAAAALWRVPGFEVSGVEVLTTMQRDHVAPNAGVHRTRFLPRHHVQMLDGIPITTPARMLFDLASLRAVTFARLERAMENCLSRKLVKVGALHDMYAEMPKRGRRGIVAMRSLLDVRPVGYIAVGSGLEATFLRILEQHRVPLPVRQLDLGNADGWLARVDFVYRELRIIIEIDSDLFHSSKLDLEADAARDRALRAAGWRIVLRFRESDLRDRPAWVAAQVREALRAVA